MRPTMASVIALLGAVGGLIFAGFSTYDFVAHLDRQVHGVHCSFLPGLGAPDITGASGCHVTLMSPYSSVLRDGIWGGIPISLAAMGVFAFLLAFVLYLVLSRRQRDAAGAGFLLAGSLVPLFASLGMGYLALATLDAVCKLCVGIYVSSALLFIGALWLRLAASRARMPAEPESEAVALPDLRFAALIGAFSLGVSFVALPVGVYAATAPDFSDYIGSCGQLEQAAPPGVLVSLGGEQGSVDVIEVLDPLCPACGGFERRFAAQSLANEVRRKALLFPLDSECNWMVDSRIHPGACALSEAILCAGDEADEVLAWAFEEQERLRESETATPGAAARLTVQRFPALAGCVGSSRTRARLNLALRWAVANRMPVLTPQVYVAGRRMCDEDTDLGMDWALARLVERALGEGPHIPSPPEPESPVVRAAPRPARVEVRRVDPAPAEPAAEPVALDPVAAPDTPFEEPAPEVDVEPPPSPPVIEDPPPVELAPAPEPSPLPAQTPPDPSPSDEETN